MKALKNLVYSTSRNQVLRLVLLFLFSSSSHHLYSFCFAKKDSTNVIYVVGEAHDRFSNHFRIQTLKDAVVDGKVYVGLEVPIVWDILINDYINGGDSTLLFKIVNEGNRKFNKGLISLLVSLKSINVNCSNIDIEVYSFDLPPSDDLYRTVLLMQYFFTDFEVLKDQRFVEILSLKKALRKKETMKAMYLDLVNILEDEKYKSILGAEKYKIVMDYVENMKLRFSETFHNKTMLEYENIRERFMENRILSVLDTVDAGVIFTGNAHANKKPDDNIYGLSQNDYFDSFTSQIIEKSNDSIHAITVDYYLRGRRRYNHTDLNFLGCDVSKFFPDNEKDFHKLTKKELAAYTFADKRCDTYIIINTKSKNYKKKNINTSCVENNADEK